ncbi:MAG: iron-sulfur cluster assembly scaffold protein [Candidatus Heimdallarchaeota archaeon]|nr:MAG: iron-sulfur cluster assembly scaffold protein [Candidatus Heimdallarchaeota archaeon]
MAHIYSKEVMDLFMNPKNMGEIENPSGLGKVGNPVCGDVMWIYLQVNEETDIIEDIKVKTFGCVAAIATSSKTTEMAKGKTVTEAYKITKKQVADDLGGLPKQKMHCSNLAVDALQRAIINYLEKTGRSVEEID